MDRRIKINDRVTLGIVEMYGDTTVNVYLDNNSVYVCKVNKTGVHLGVGYKFNDSYLAIFSRDVSKEPNLIKIEAVYDIKNQKAVQLTEENSEIFEYMCISKKKIEPAVVIQFLNDNELKITENGEVEKFIKYITAGNDNITKDEIKTYILNAYPDLIRYTNLTTVLSVIDYRKILSELNVETCEFHIMPHLLK